MKQQHKQKSPRRVRLRSLTDCERQMVLLYKENRNDLLSDSKLTVLSNHLHKIHTQMVARMDLAVSEELLALEERLTLLQERS